VYSFEPNSYKYQALFLAEEMQTYCDAMAGFIKSGSEIVVNKKLNPWLKVRDMACERIIKLSRELGLTPASRLPCMTI
jgi:phage terminase small subunit